MDQQIIEPTNKNHRVLFIIMVIILTAGIIGGSVYFLLNKEIQKQDKKIEELQSKGKENKKTEPKVAKTDEAKTELVKKIYFTDNNNLYSVNPVDKKNEMIDTGILNNGGSVGYGSNSPLMSKDQLRVAYIKNGEIWLKEEGSDKKKIDQPTPKKTAGNYNWWISGWSSDSENFSYAISFDCGMGEDNCDANMEDKVATGFYYYSLKSGKSTKLPLSSISMWQPNSNKIVYFEKINDLHHLKNYDINTKEIGVLTKNGWSGTEPQIAFSDDGTKIIYSYGDSNVSTSKIVIADNNNENQKVLKQGKWAELQWPRFINGSKADYTYSHSEGWSCPGGGTGCPAFILYSVSNDKTTKVAEIINHITGFDSSGQVIVLTGYSYDKNSKRTLSLINLENKAVTALYEGKEKLNAKMSWQ